MIIASNVAAAASATNFTGAASLSATDDFYNGKYLTFTSGPLTGRRAEIVDYIGATRTFVVGPGFSASPGVGNSFEIESSDSGRSQFDNITRDATPTIFLRLDDDFLLNDLRGGAAGQLPPDSQRIPIPFRGPVADAHLPGYRVAIFAENNTQVPVFQGYADQVAGQPGVYAFTFTNPLDDGSHFITAKVQMVDPAVDFNTDYGSASAALEIVIDTQRPSVYFGNPVAADDGLDAASDSGSIARPVTFSDRITNETTPTFWGTGEANSVIRLYVDQNLNGVVDANDVLIAVTTVVPLDGTNQFLQGRWEATSNIDLNDPQYFARDGQRQILVTAEDPSGNVSDGTTLDSLRIFVDTQAPRVAGVFVTGTAFDLFDPKPSVNGPTPAVNSIDVHILDFPLRVSPDWLYNALVAEIATIPGNYMLVGDHVGQIVIEAVAIVSPVAANGAPASATVRLFFSSPLPDDRYTLSVSDNLVDPAGNQLDGESNAFAPTENPTLPSGDGVPGGNFVGRFTVDSRPEIGVVSEGLIYVDINGNSLWDPTGINHDLTNRDLVFQLGRPTDRVFAGQFTATGAAAANGFDRLGAYGRVNGVYSFAFDTDDDGVADMVSPMPSQYQVNGMPVAGNFSNAKPGDEIGLFDGTYWYLDLNGNNRIDAGERIPSNFTGLALVGDFNGDGQDDLATFDTATNTFYFDTNRDGTWDYQWNVSDDVQRFIGIPGFTAIPLAGDLNLDGIDDIGLWVKGRNGVLPRNAGETFFWVSDQRNANPANVFDAFSPAPLGNDLYTQFGDELALPVFGNFDPPVAAESAAPNPYPLHRSHDRADVNGDGHVTPLDALLVLNHLASRVELPWHNPSLTLALADGRMLDVSGDNQITPLDALLVLNEVSRRARGEGEATRSSQLGVSSIEAIDRVFDELGSGFDLEENQRKRKAKLA